MMGAASFLTETLLEYQPRKNVLHSATGESHVLLSTLCREVVDQTSRCVNYEGTWKGKHFALTFLDALLIARVGCRAQGALCI